MHFDIGIVYIVTALEVVNLSLEPTEIQSPYLNWWLEACLQAQNLQGRWKLIEKEAARNTFMRAALDRADDL